MLESMEVFVGKIEKIETNSLVVDVVDVFESTIHLPKSVCVVYAPSQDGVILGEP